MAHAATKNRLGGRLAASQILGTVLGLLIAGAVGQMITSRALSFSVFPQILAAALVFGIPFYAASVLILHHWAENILAHPLVWCIGLPGAALISTLSAFPVTGNGIFWVDLIPLCALCAGLVFVVWQKQSPLVYVR